MQPNITLIFDKSSGNAHKNFIPKMDIEEEELQNIIPRSFQRIDLPLPDIPEVEIVRHYIDLSKKNYGVDNGQ